MRYIVGYHANDRGQEAVALAATLARTRGAELDIVLVVPPRQQTFDPYSPNRAYTESLDEHAERWLDQAALQVPRGITVRTHLRYADSTAEGLIDAAAEMDAGLIVVGAARGGVLNRFTIGSVANALLHSSTTPVALAPRGYETLGGITRITCASGERSGAQVLLDVAIESASSRQVELRLMSLVALDDADTPAARRGSPGSSAVPTGERAEAHAAALAEKARAALPDACPVTTSIGQGDSVEEAVEALEFDPTELVLVGSSRLAAQHRIFLGPAANKILRALPVPMVVVPRDYQVPPGHPTTGDETGRSL